jgi:hypothetical protein
VTGRAGGEPDAIALGELIGVGKPGRSQATLDTSRAVMMKVFAARRAEPAAYRLTGAASAELVVF